MLASAFGNWAYLWLWTGHGVGNYADDLTILVITVLVWPHLRHKIEAFAKRHVEAGNAELHKKLDHSIALSQHIIKHHPSIPPFDAKSPAPTPRPKASKPS